VNSSVVAGEKYSIILQLGKISISRFERHNLAEQKKMNIDKPKTLKLFSLALKKSQSPFHSND